MIVLVLGSILGTNWRWSEELYDNVFNLCLVLTNIHIRHQPLRAEDGLRDNQMNRINAMAREHAKNVGKNKNDTGQFDVAR